jgi:prefoldin subunit 5
MKENAELRENIQQLDNLIEIIQRHIRELDLQIYGPQDCAKESNN